MFGYSRQRYYRSIKNTAKNKGRASLVVEMVRELRIQMPRLGARKLYFLLEPKLSKLGVGREKLFKILKANHLLIKPLKSYHKTTNSFHRFRKHKNLIEEMKLEKPEQLWVADITYVGTRTNPMYLSLVTDAYSKRIVGYHLSRSLATEGSLIALQMGINKREYKGSSLIHHSDRGFQYCSDAYQKEPSKNIIRCSMTESYDPYANAIAERINGILKQEFLAFIKTDEFSVMKQVISQSINIYNDKRPHYSCNYNTPNYMHKQKQVKIKTYKSKNHFKNILEVV